MAVCEAAIRGIRSSGSPRTIFDATIARLCLHREFQRIDIAVANSAATSDAEKKNVSSSDRHVALNAPAALPTPMRDSVAPRVQAQSNPQTTRPSSTPHSLAPTPSSTPNSFTPTQASTQAPTQTPIQAPPLTQSISMSATQAWDKIAAAATSTPEKVLAESFVPVSLNNNQLTLRAAESAGGAATYAARKSEMLQTLVARALGPGWKLLFETPAQAPEQTIAPMHGLDKDLMQMLMIQHAMDAFDAIVVKVEQAG